MPAPSIRKYRLTGPSEPSERMMSQLLEAACEQAREQAEKARCAYFDDLAELVEETLEAWDRQTEEEGKR